MKTVPTLKKINLKTSAFNSIQFHDTEVYSTLYSRYLRFIQCPRSKGIRCEITNITQNVYISCDFYYSLKKGKHKKKFESFFNVQFEYLIQESRAKRKTKKKNQILNESLDLYMHNTKKWRGFRTIQKQYNVWFTNNDRRPISDMIWTLGPVLMTSGGQQNKKWPDDHCQ